MTRVEITLNGRLVSVPAEGSLAAALLGAGETVFRRSASGEPRAPLCGMGVCFECAVTVDGVAHRRSCMIPVRAGMEVVTGG